MVTRNLDVVLSASTRGFSTAMTAASAALKSFDRSVDATEANASTRFKNINRVSQGISVALLAAGAASATAALQFDRSMTQIETLVGVAGSEVDGFRTSILALSGDTARGPAELADALFTVTSAGLRGTEALDTLELAAQASAIGLGQTRAVAQLTASALNAYRADGLNAADATDILVASVRAGNFEASQLANSLGRVLPNAATLKVGLEEVGGAVALLTRTSGNAAQAVTGLDSLLRAFIKPTQEAKEALEDVGLTFDGLTRQLADEGLVSVLDTLDTAFEGNRQQLAKVITDTQGLTAANVILNATQEDIAATFGETANAAGILSEAFATAAESDAFRFDQALNRLQVILVTLGQSTLPVVADVLEEVGDIFKLVADVVAVIPSDVIAFTGALLALQAAGLPIITTLATIAGNAGRMALALGTAGSSLSTVGASGATLTAGLSAANLALVGVGAAATAGFLVWREYNSRQEEAKQRADELTTALLDQEGSLPNLVNQFDDLADSLLRTSKELDAIEGDFGDTQAEIEGFVEKLLDLGTDGGADLFRELGLSVSDVLPIIKTGTDEFEALQGEIDALFTETQDSEEQFRRLGDRISQIADSDVRLFAERLLEGTIATGGSILALQDLLDVLDETADSYDDVTNEERAAVITKLELVAGYSALDAATRNRLVSLVEEADTMADLEAVMVDVNEEIGQLETREKRLLDIASGATDEIAAQAEAARFWDLNVTSFFLPATSRAIEITDELIESGRANAERISQQAEQLVGLAGSYDAVNTAATPYKNLIRALEDPALRFAETQNNIAIAFGRVRDEIKGEDGLAAQFRAGGTSAAAAENRLIGFARELQGLTVDLLAGADSAGQASTLYQELVADFIDLATEATGSREEAELLASQLLDIPPQVISDIVANTAEAEEDVDRLTQKALAFGEANPVLILAVETRIAEAKLLAFEIGIGNLTNEEFVATLDVENDEADFLIAQTILNVAGFPGDYLANLIAEDKDVTPVLVAALEQVLGFEGRYTADLETRYIDELGPGVLAQYQDIISQWEGESTRTLTIDTRVTGVGFVETPLGQGVGNGSGFVLAQGGVLERFANGGESHVAQIAPAGAWRLWAEPETGGEAYIPLSPTKRGRSTQILEDVARRFGYSLMKQANGGIMAMQNGGTVTFGGDAFSTDVIVNVQVAPTGAGGPNITVERGAVVINGSESSDTGHTAAITSALERLCGEIRQTSTTTTGLVGGSRIR